MPALTAEEAAVYDRQLRVWGVEAQQRMRSSKVLVLGCRGAAIEVRRPGDGISLERQVCWRYTVCRTRCDPSLNSATLY